MSALLFTACNKAEVVPPSISKQKEIFVWNNNLKSSISQEEYDNAMLAYVKSKYPSKVKAYKKKLIKDNTLMLNNLIWQDNLEAKRKRTWQDAKEYCRNLSLLGFTDWRLGNANELRNLYKNRSKLKYLSSSEYWSSGQEGKYVWIEGFISGYVDGNDKDNRYPVRCVRDGQLFDF